MRNGSLLLSLVVCVSIPLAAAGQQLADWRVEVRGDILAGPDTQYTATLDNLQHQRVAETPLESNNSFAFHGIDRGDFWLTIADSHGDTLFFGMVNTSSRFSQVTVDAAPARERAMPPSGPVSVAELRHPPSGKAIAAMREAEKLTRAEQFAAAAAQLEKAVRLSPDWPRAHTNLSAAYMRLGRYDDAIAESRRALALAGPNAMDLGNLAFAQACLHRRAEAMESARAGLAMEPASPKLHYILGFLLAMDRTTLAEALPHLELAAPSLPSAQAVLTAVRQALAPPVSASAVLPRQQ